MPADGLPVPGGRFCRHAGDRKTPAVRDEDSSMRVVGSDLNVGREPFVRPFGFKGGAFSEKWLTVVGLRDASGRAAVGVGGLAVLWSDPRVFFGHSEVGGNMLMVLLLERAMQMIRGRRYGSPLECLRDVFEPLHAYAEELTGQSGLRKTFTLNSLVGLDNAMWLLFAQERGATVFDDMIPPEFRGVLACRQDTLLRLPVMPYRLPVEDLRPIADGGWLLPKIKLGQPGTQEEMLAKDRERLTEIHASLGGTEARYSEDGRIRYYLDANGRYEHKETLRRLLDHADGIGMLGQIALVEEPFSEDYREEVGDLPVPVAADESLHGIEDIAERVGLGYRIMTLKPAGKTLSATLEMALEAARLGVPCCVADSACVPVLVDWNRNLAARLAPLPGLRYGFLESNGPENYRNWEELVRLHPHYGADWVEAPNGVFRLGRSFYDSSGGVPGEAGHYVDMVCVRG